MEADDRKTFKTAFELNQRDIVIQAAARQKWISQAQSLNLFFAPGSSGQLSAAYLHDVHMMAFDLGLKSLYYLRSESVLRASSVEGKGKANAAAKVVDIVQSEACSVCQ